MYRFILVYFCYDSVIIHQHWCVFVREWSRFVIVNPSVSVLTRNVVHLIFQRILWGVFNPSLPDYVQYQHCISVLTDISNSFIFFFSIFNSDSPLFVHFCFCCHYCRLHTTLLTVCKIDPKVHSILELLRRHLAISFSGQS